MSDAHPADHFSAHIRRYLFVFYALLFGTVITVLASYIQFPHRAVNIGLALFIASGKAFPAAGYFRHLISQRKMLYGVLPFTAFFFVARMLPPDWPFPRLPSTPVLHCTRPSHPL